MICATSTDETVWIAEAAWDFDLFFEHYELVRYANGTLANDPSLTPKEDLGMEKSLGWTPHHVWLLQEAYEIINLMTKELAVMVEQRAKDIITIEELKTKPKDSPVSWHNP